MSDEHTAIAGFVDLIDDFAPAPLLLDTQMSRVMIWTYSNKP